MLRISAIVGIASTLVVASFAYVAAAPTDSYPYFDNGHLYVVQVDEGQFGPYNKSASIQNGRLKIAEPTNSWSLSQVKPPTRYRGAVVIVKASNTTCLTAHKRKGPSYLYLDQCTTSTNKTGNALKDLQERQYFVASPDDHTTYLYQEVDLNSNLRPVHVINSTQEVHLAASNEVTNMVLAFQAAYS